jgi:SAM-dependent methyltransferase
MRRESTAAAVGAWMADDAVRHAVIDWSAGRPHAQVMTREPQYAACFQGPPVKLGPMLSDVWRRDSMRLVFVLSRYKFVARMLAGAPSVAEIGCGDGFASAIVRDRVDYLHLYDFDPAFVAAAKEHHDTVVAHDIIAAPLPRRYHAVFMLDVFEHIQPVDEGFALKHVVKSLTDDGTFIVGMPSIESQEYASAQSKAGHVNCKSGGELAGLMRRYFGQVLLFGMNDEVVHTGFPPMCHYLFVACHAPRPGAEFIPVIDEDVTGGNGHG